MASVTESPPPFHLARVDQVTDAAYLKLGACGGRLAKAAALVRNGDVTLLPQGFAAVRSQSTPERTYTVNGSCPCDDATHRAPDGRCKHLLAKWLMQPLTHAMPSSTDDIPSRQGIDTVPTVPLPEAPASVNVRVTIAGREVQVTLRDSDEQRLLARLATLLEQYPVEASPQPKSPQQYNAEAMHRPTNEPLCPTHGAMKRSTKGKGWYCPVKLADGSWCKGKEQGR